MEEKWIYKNILIETTSNVKILGNIDDKGIDISCSDENLLNQKYFFTIYKADDKLNKQEQIGNIEMTYMDVCMAEEIGWSIYELFDLLDSDKEGIYKYLFDSDEFPNDEYVGIGMDVLYIDKIFIEKKYRKLGIGSKIIKELPRFIRQILKLRPGCIASKSVWNERRSY